MFRSTVRANRPTIAVAVAVAALAGCVTDDPDPPAAAPAAPAVTRSPAPEPTWSPVGPRVVVPDVVGRNAAAAAAQLEALGFTRVLCTTPDEDDGFRPTAEWTVTGQKEAAGTTMAAGDAPFYLQCARVR